MDNSAAFVDLLQISILPVLLLGVVFFLLRRSSGWTGVQRPGIFVGVCFGAGLFPFLVSAAGLYDYWRNGAWEYIFMLAAMFGSVSFFAKLFDWLYKRFTE